jgi:pimeloyl-ACP methyl ester carboxylesterase
MGYTILGTAQYVRGAMRAVTGFLWTVLLIYLLGIIMLAALQRQMIYFPQTENAQSLVRIAKAMGLQPWNEDDGQLIGWREQPSQNALRRIVIFHGNAGYALHRDYYVTGLKSLNAGWEPYLFEYPGYGSRIGKSSEDGIKRAASRAIELLLQDDASPIYLIGESLGSGVASYLASRYPGDIAGMLLVTPFTSLVDVAAGHYPFVPVRALLREKYDSLEALNHYDGPIAFLLAGNDEVVPTELGRQLHDSYDGPKWLEEFPGAGHNSMPFHPGSNWWREVSDFLLNNLGS